MGSTFLTMLAGGIFGLTAASRTDQIAWRFYRVVAITVSLLLGGVFGLMIRNRAWQSGTLTTTALAVAAVGSVIALALVVMTASEAIYRPRVVRPLSIGGTVAALTTAGLLGQADGIFANANTLLALISMVLSATVIGSVTLATMLGHAYLTATKMTIAPLRRLAGVFAGAMIARCLWVVLVAGGMSWSLLNGGEPAAVALRGDVLMISVRVAVGLLIPLVFAYMVWETVKLRATQSATGILYFTLVLAYVGELTGLYLVRQTGIPF